MPDEESPPGERAPPHRTRRVAIWVAVLLVFALVLWWALAGGPNRAGKHAVAMPPVAITTATAARRDVPIYLDAIGTVTPVHTASITSQVTGRVIDVRYQEGQRVHRGDPLVDIDPRPLAATLMQAEGILERDQQVLAQARMDLERYRAAWAKHAIQRQLLEDQEKIVLQDEGTVKLDRGTVEFDRVQLAYCHITAPLDGRIGLRLVDPGNVVAANAGAVLAVITQMQPISVVFTLSEDDLGELLAQPGHGAGLRVDVLDRTRTKLLATGRLITIDNQIDTVTGTVRLRALFENFDETLFPNQFVNTKLLVRTERGATVVATSAIQHSGEQTSVFVVQDGHVHAQRVTTGPSVGDVTEVTGLAPGAVVANSSFEKLRDGAAVTVVRAPPPAAAGSAGV